MSEKEIYGDVNRHFAQELPSVDIGQEGAKGELCAYNSGLSLSPLDDTYIELSRDDAYALAQLLLNYHRTGRIDGKTDEDRDL